MCLALSQVGVLSKQAGLGTEAFFDWATRKFGYLYKIWILPTGTLSVTLDLDNFATARRLSKLIFFSLSLGSTKVVSQSVINWTVVGQIIRATIQTVIVYHADRLPLSTAQYRRAGSSATADTLFIH